MSTNHPFDPNHNDLPPERGADARKTGADALDDLLNEIAQGTRHTTARHGEGHHEPKRRSQSRDAQEDDLQAFTQAFHQRVEQSAASEPGGAALDPTLWEQIMARTTPGQPAAATATGHPGMSGTIPSSRVRPAAPPSRSRPQRLYGQILANATLALLVVLTAFGAWMVYDRMIVPPPSGPETNVPGLGMQPDSTPETGPVPTTAAPGSVPSTPETSIIPTVAAQEPAFACDFTRDIPIFQQVDDSPVEGAALLLTTSGDLALTCPEEPEPIVLASGLGQVAPTSWPGIVYTSTPLVEGSLQPDITYVNILTGKTLTIGSVQSESTQGINLSSNTPLLVHPLADAPEQWAVTDLRTMETRQLSSFVDEPSAFPPATPLMVAESGGVMVIGIKTANDIEGPGHLADVSGLPGSLLVLNAYTNESHWINTPDDLDPVIGMTIAPDGDFLALKSSDAEGDDPRGTVTYTVIRTSDGAQLTQSEGIDDPGATSLWAADGDAFVYANDGNLMKLDPKSSTGEPSKLLESSDVLSNPRPTYDPMVINVDSIQQEEIATETPDQARSPQVLLVNLATGDITTVDGTDTSINLSPYEQESRFLVMADTYVTSNEPATYRVLDAVTGEELGQITDVVTPIGQGGYANLGLHSIASTSDGSTEVFGYNPGQLWLMIMEGDQPVIRELAPIPGREDATQGKVNIFLSPDGNMLSLTIEGDEARTRWLLPLDAETDEWIEAPSTVPGSNPGYTFFVTGTGARG